MSDEVLPNLNGLLTYFQAERHKKTDKKEIAIMAFYVAANETEIYMAQLKESGRRNRKRELELSRLWSRAGAAVRQVNKNLSQRFLQKSQIWISPEKWKHEHVRILGLGLSQVREEAAKLL